MSATAVMTTVVPQRRVMSLQATAPPRASSLKAEARFGQYVLGQTLGEGEFGKVKLGWPYARNGTNSDAQVAIKLIRKESVGSSRSRIVKIEREISVLRRVRHPNIVKCHEVVETTKYIGIILEYASGGELFDYILAHRYLRDPIASRLFAQLISAVQYLHLRGIVHRDLKLENLLLDRNRNIIITDFGFANTFDPLQSSDDGEAMKRREMMSNGKILGDLMQTSCGSPCYAAPELVVSEGYYCGRKVDVWSCGVILYAMLAGYLPFDDDPSNPEGDNISLLYRYIVNTPLTFPEYVTPLARDLLRRILVPDPLKRAFLADIVSHQWLVAHTHIISLAEDPYLQRHSTSHNKAGSQDMLRSASERTASYTSAALPSISHLVPTGFAKNTSMSPPSLPPVLTISTATNKRHTVQIEYEKPLLSTARAGQQDDLTLQSQVAAVEGLSIAASPSMARSVSHSGTQDQRSKDGVRINTQVSARATSRLPVPDVKPRPTSYHPSLQSSTAQPYDNIAQAEAQEQAHKGSIKVKRESWSRGSISNSKTASPRSTKQNVTGEISGPSSQDSTNMTAGPVPGNAQTMPAPITRTRRQHKRNSSSISIVFSKLWSGSSQLDNAVVEDEESVIGTKSMNAIAENAAESAATERDLQVKSRSVPASRNRYSLVGLANRLNLMSNDRSYDVSLSQKDTESSSTNNKDIVEDQQHVLQGKKKSAGQITRGTDKASTSAAKRVMEFFSTRRKHKAQEP